MPYKKKVGGKGKKKGKNNTNFVQDVLTRDKIIKEQERCGLKVLDIWYAKVNKVHSGDRLQATYYGLENNTDLVDVYVKKRLRRARPKKGDYLLIQAREYNKNQYDAVLFYRDHESKKLLKWKEIPQDTTSTISFFIEDEDDEDEETLSKSQKRKLRLQRNQGADSYLNMNELFNECPGDKSIFNKFDEENENTEEGQLVKNAKDFIKNMKDKDTETSESEDDESDNDIEVDVVEEYNSSEDDEDNFI